MSGDRHIFADHLHRSAPDHSRVLPSKRINTPHWTVEEALTQGRTTRRTALEQEVKAKVADANLMYKGQPIAPSDRVTKSMVAKPPPDVKHESEPCVFSKSKASPAASTKKAPQRRARVIFSDD